MLKHIFLLVPLTLSACLPDEGKEISALKEDNRQLKEQLEKLQTQVRVLDLLRTQESLAGPQESVHLTVDNEGFQPIKTSLGVFLIKLKSVEDYVDGYKIRIGLGNPFSAEYSNISYVAEYGPNPFLSSDDQPEFNRKMSAKKKKEGKSVIKLSPNSWNTLELVLSPASKEDLESLYFKFQPESISLYDKR